MKRRLTLPLALGAAFLLAGCAGDPSKGSAAEEVYVAAIDGEINGRVAEYVGRVISEGEDAGARAVVMRIDTPGGDLESTKEIVQAESNAEGVPVITYVTPRGGEAASAGSIIVMGSDVAAMAPETSIGATTPVDAFGRNITGDLGRKITNNAVSLITGLAEAHDRNEAWAEDAVRDAASVYAEEALDLGVVEYVKPDLRAVLRAADGERVEPKGITLDTAGATLVRRPPNFGERFGFSPLLVAIPAILVALFAVGGAVAVLRTNRSRVTTGKEGMIGEIGVVRRPVADPSGGTVFVHGELWKAFPEGGEGAPMQPGAEVEVVGFRRAAILVRPAGEPQGMEKGPAT